MTAEGKSDKRALSMGGEEPMAPLITDPIALHVHFYFQTKRRRDLDNQNKLILDALTGVVYGDDSQIDELHLYRHYDKENPRIEVDLAILNSLMKAPECSQGKRTPRLEGIKPVFLRPKESAKSLWPYLISVLFASVLGGVAGAVPVVFGVEVIDAIFGVVSVPVRPKAAITEDNNDGDGTKYPCRWTHGAIGFGRRRRHRPLVRVGVVIGHRKSPYDHQRLTFRMFLAW
jgi:hypothetical protein